MYFNMKVSKKKPFGVWFPSDSENICWYDHKELIHSTQHHLISMLLADMAMTGKRYCTGLLWVKSKQLHNEYKAETDNKAHFVFNE